MHSIVETRPSKNRLAPFSFTFLAALLFCFGPVAGTLQAQQTTSFTYQGRLTNAGNPATGNYDLEIKLFDTATVGTGVQQGATLVMNPVGASAGVFTVALDFGADVFDGSARYLEIGVRPAGSVAAYTLLAPRQPVSSTPYAIKSLNAAAADGLSSACSGCVTSTQIGSLPADNGNYIQNTTALQAASFNISGNSFIGGNVGLGTTNPLARLHLANASSFGAGLFVEASEGDRAAMYYTPDVGMILDSFRPSDGRRLPLYLQPLGGNVVFGGSVGVGKDPSAGIKLDVVGNVVISPGNGVMQFGTPNSENGLSSIVGSGRADLRFDGGTLKLVAGPVGSIPPSTNGIVVNTFGNVGIGTTTPTQGRLHVSGGSLNGVYGSSNFKGVWGESAGNLGVGVYGNSTATNGYGLYGIATGGAGGIGVYAQGSQYAGYFSGNVHVAGNLSKSGGSFLIDHPIDPANKYLSHSFVESPDMMNIYNGNITTDSNGDATITLPDYFEALNRDFRYQLTVIGKFAQAIVASEVTNNRFSIKTDKPEIKVSWQVTGIRQDAFANANRIRVEEDKPESERGFYLHPQVFGESEEKSIEWPRDPKGMKQRKEERELALREQRTAVGDPFARP